MPDVQLLAGHRYLVDGVERPGVTSILRANGLMDVSHFTETAAARGTAVHLGCQLIDDGELDDVTIAPEIAPYLTAYRDFLAHMQPEWLYVEMLVADPVLGYAGTLDRAGFLRGEPVIADIKTGEVPPWAGLQLAAYRRCLPTPDRWRRYVLRLMGDGRWSWLPENDPHDERVFLSALVVQQWQATHGLIGVAA